MQEGKWIKDGPCWVLTKGEYRAIIRTSRRSAGRQVWVRIVKRQGDGWAMVRWLPPFNSLEEAKLEVEYSQYFGIRKQSKEELEKYRYKSSKKAVNAWWED